MLEVNDWMLLNAITYKIQLIDDFSEMRMMVIKQMKNFFDFDSASFYIADSSGHLSEPLGIGYAKSDMDLYLNVFQSIDYSKGLMDSGKNIAYRETDIISDKQRTQTEYYKKVYAIQGWHYSLHLNLSFNEQFLGVLSFFRQKDKSNFTHDDIFILDVLKDHLALRLYRENTSGQSTINCSRLSHKYKLTPQESTVLQYIASGKTNTEIAVILVISQSTLKKHILNIYKKTDVNSKLQLLSLIH